MTFQTLTPDLVHIIASYLYGSPKIHKSSDLADIKFFARNAFLYNNCVTKCCFCEHERECTLNTVFNGDAFAKLYSCDNCEYNTYKYCLLGERRSILQSDIIISRSDGSFSFATIINIYRKTTSIFSEPLVVCQIDAQKYPSIKSLIDQMESYKPSKQSDIIKTIYHHEMIETMTRFLLNFM